MMFRIKVLLHFVILLVSQTHATIKYKVQSVDCNSKVSLECENGTTKKFSAVAWYKMVSGKDNFLVRMEKGQRAENYSNDTRMTLSKNKSLIISTVTPKDSGLYQCKIYASVGGANAISGVNLTVRECVETTLMTTFMTSVTAVTHSSTGPQLQVDHHDVLPVTWSIGVFLVVVVCKIALSLIAVKVRTMCASASVNA
ncbi:uncharacterized protein ACB058_018941 [Synchiropus picturatus]